MPFGRQNRAIAASKRGTNVSGLIVLLGDDNVGRHEAVSCSAEGAPARIRMTGTVRDAGGRVQDGFREAIAPEFGSRLRGRGGIRGPKVACGARDRAPLRSYSRLNRYWK